MTQAIRALRAVKNIMEHKKTAALMQWKDNNTADVIAMCIQIVEKKESALTKKYNKENGK